MATSLGGQLPWFCSGVGVLTSDTSMMKALLVALQGPPPSKKVGRLLS